MQLAFTVLALSVSFVAACESSKPPGAEDLKESGPNVGVAVVPSGLAPLSSAAFADKPLPAPSVATSTTTEPEIIAAQHVLVAFQGAKRAPASVKRSKADAKKLAEDVAQKAKEGADFSDLVKRYSDEPGSAERLGNLGKFKRDAMAKPFSEVAFALEIGKVSRVVETEFGFHIIKRNQ